MKPLLFLFMMFLLPNYLLAQQKYVKIDLEDTEYLFPAKKAYLKKSGEPLQGNFELKINRYQREKSTFIDGLKNGETKIYRNKMLVETGNYESDLKIGDWKYYFNDGRLWKITPFKNGLKDGVEKEFSGETVTRTTIYQKNKANGLSTEYYNNFIKSKKNYEDGKLKDTSYYYAYSSNTIEKKCFNSTDTNFCINYNRYSNAKILDTIFYNSKNQPTLLKAYANDSLKLKMLIDYTTVIKDLINVKVNKVDVYEGDKLKISYFFPNQYNSEFTVESRILSLLDYEVYHYTDTKKIVLHVNEPSKSSFEKETFYQQYPNGDLKRVEFIDGKDDVLTGWYYRDIR